jgi:hypothetical protein
MKVFRSMANTIHISSHDNSVHLNYNEIHELIIFLRKEYPEQFFEREKKNVK